MYKAEGGGRMVGDLEELEHRAEEFGSGEQLAASCS